MLNSSKEPILANRLRKRFKHFSKWAKRRNISCFRIYDHDIPEYPVTADYYEGRVALWISNRTRDDSEEARQAFHRNVIAQTLSGLEIEQSALFVKDRRPGGQYKRHGYNREEFVVQEGGCRFLVNLSDYHDTGLFLDHRLMRSLAASESSGRRFLNLFCYTGSFTVYAGAAGAASTVSVDLSSRYLDWLERNLRLNNLHHKDNTLIEDDVVCWLEDAVRDGQRFDVIVCDPPTFSNSKMTADIFEVERDHSKLIEHCLKLLSPGGHLYFSTNKRSFNINVPNFPNVTWKEITSQTISPDFANSKSHRSWLFQTIP
ncbi:MAG: class I SAM-dependent methyltransferase [Candidatus Bruticola sp.]